MPVSWDLVAWTGFEEQEREVIRSLMYFDFYYVRNPDKLELFLDVVLWL
jgi:hypothetical protein